MIVKSDGPLRIYKRVTEGLGAWYRVTCSFCRSAHIFYHREDAWDYFDQHNHG